MVFGLLLALDEVNKTDSVYVPGIAGTLALTTENVTGVYAPWLRGPPVNGENSNHGLLLFTFAIPKLSIDPRDPVFDMLTTETPPEDDVDRTYESVTVLDESVI